MQGQIASIEEATHKGVVMREGRRRCCMGFDVPGTCLPQMITLM